MSCFTSTRRACGLTLLSLFSLFEIRPKPYGNELRVWKYNEEEDVFEESTNHFKDE